MFEILNDNPDPGLPETLHIHVAGTVLTGQVGIGIQGLANVNQPIRGILTQVKVRSPDCGSMRQF